MTTKDNLTPEEKESLKILIAQIEDGEMSQVEDLMQNCNNVFQFAKTHSVYIRDWEKTKEKMESDLENGILPPGISENLYKEIIDATDNIIKKKLEMVQYAFEIKFGESIYNYLGHDGKTKKIFGIFG